MSPLQKSLVVEMEIKEISIWRRVMFYWRWLQSMIYWIDKIYDQATCSSGWEEGCKSHAME
jgi:hypothetical protein